MNFLSSHYEYDHVYLYWCWKFNIKWYYTKLMKTKVKEDMILRDVPVTPQKFLAHMKWGKCRKLLKFANFGAYERSL